MENTIEFLIVAFMFVARIAVPLLVLSGVLYLLKRWLEPHFEDETTRSRIKLAVPPLLISIGSLVALALILIVGYALVTNRFVELLIMFRGVAVIVYLFILRIGVPLILLIGIGSWIERKLNPGSASEHRPLSDRLPFLRRLPKLPHLSPRGILAVTLLGALWASFIGVTISRFFFGLSYTTNMSDQYPWGLWLGFDMISGVALSAGGFIMAGTVYVFNIKRFHPIVRPAVLTAFLGYVLAILGLLFDLGRWYNVWHAMFMWNLHSPLIEVAWCVMLYTTVLALEFSPIVFERFHLNWPLKVMRRITIPLVIAGICLSTLHQSTLGTLFLIFPQKMNPLWYSPLLPVFFFISACAVGLGMIIIESNLSARAFGRELEKDLLTTLGKAASLVLGLYLVLKIVDMVMRGATPYLVAADFRTILYWVEMLGGVVIPMVILATRRGRENPRVLFASSAFIVGGVVLNRLNTTLFSWWSFGAGGNIYVPTPAEFIGTISLISIGVVAFGLIAKNFPVFEQEQHAHGAAE